MSSPVHEAAQRPVHPVTITIDAAHPGPVIPDDFAGLSFERGPLTPGNAGVAGDLFSPGNNSLITLFRNLGLGSLRIAGGSGGPCGPAGRGAAGGSHPAGPPPPPPPPGGRHTDSPPPPPAPAC